MKLRGPFDYAQGQDDNFYIHPLRTHDLYVDTAEAPLSAESGSGSGFVHNRRFPLLDSPAT